MDAPGALTHVLPIPSAITYVLLRALQTDVAEDELCGVAGGSSIQVTAQWHSPLLGALIPIPRVEPGDTVWWHPDLIHSVPAVVRQPALTNLLYIPATPYCPKNATYSASVRRLFLEGRSPADFGCVRDENDWIGRAGIDDLNEVGRQQLGFPDEKISADPLIR
jgi:hypothetical protein